MNQASRGPPTALLQKHTVVLVFLHQTDSKEVLLESQKLVQVAHEALPGPVIHLFENSDC